MLDPLIMAKDKDLASKPHAERMAALMRDLNSSTSLSSADEVLELMKREWQEALSIRALIASRHGAVTPPTTPPPVAQTAEAHVEEVLALSPQPTGSMTVRDLIERYRTDADSPYLKNRYHTRKFYSVLIGRIEREHGDEKLRDINGREVLRWHEQWTGDGRVALAHSLVGMLRGIFGFGGTILGDAECQRLSSGLSTLRFKMPVPREERLMAEHAIAIRAEAHRRERPSIALAQAFQFDLMLRQKDCIGEWVPLNEPGPDDVTFEGWKWLRGIQWSEIDESLVLRHVTSRRQKEIIVNLHNCPMVMEELEEIGLSVLPSNGPIIVSETTNRPYRANQFRVTWREIATAVGVPKELRNADSRPLAVTQKYVESRYRTSDDGKDDSEEEIEKDRPTDADFESVGRVH